MREGEKTNPRVNSFDEWGCSRYSRTATVAARDNQHIQRFI